MQAYGARIAEFDSIFNAVVELSPDAEVIARALGHERWDR